MKKSSRNLAEGGETKSVVLFRAQSGHDRGVLNLLNRRRSIQ